jgi:hypothetical protein
MTPIYNYLIDGGYGLNILVISGMNLHLYLPNNSLLIIIVIQVMTMMFVQQLVLKIGSGVLVTR